MIIHERLHTVFQKVSDRLRRLDDRGFWRGFLSGFDIMPPRWRLPISPPSGDPLVAAWKSLDDDMKVTLYGLARSMEEFESRLPDFKLTQTESRGTSGGRGRR